MYGYTKTLYTGGVIQKLFIPILALVAILPSLFISCSNEVDGDSANGGSTGSAGSNDNGNTVVCTYYQKDDESNYYVFYADNTAEYYKDGEVENSRADIKYEGNPLQAGTVTIKITLTNTPLITFDVTESDGTVLPSVTLVPGLPSVEYTVKTGNTSNSSGNSENGESPSDNNGQTSGTGGTGGTGNTPQASDVVCKWISNDIKSNYYIFYTDKTAEYYLNGRVLYTRTSLSYMGAPNAEGQLLIANSAFELWSTFTVTKSGIIITATDTSTNAKYTMETTGSSDSSGNSGNTTGNSGSDNTGNGNSGDSGNTGGENGGDSTSGNGGGDTGNTGGESGGGSSGGNSSTSDEQVKPFSVMFDLTENGGYADVISAISGTPTKGNSGITDGPISLGNNVDLAEDFETGIKITLLASASGKIGSIQGTRTTNTPYYKYNAPAAGLIIKNAGFLVSGVKGKVKVTVDWVINGSKNANDRYMAMAVGDNYAVYEGNGDTFSATDAKSVSQTALIDAYDFGTTGGEIVIGSTNELGIKSVKIESVESVESFVTPNNRSETKGDTSTGDSGNTGEGESGGEQESTEKTYTVTVVQSAYGTISTKTTEAKPGTQIQLTATAANENYECKSISIMTSSGTLVSPSKTTDKGSTRIVYFTMPESSVTVSADFGEKTTTTPVSENSYTVKTTYILGTGTTSESAAYWEAGTEVTITIPSYEGYKCNSVSVTNDFGNEIPYELITTDSASRILTFTMPETNVTVYATFLEAGSVKSVSIEGDATVIDSFGSVLLTANTTVEGNPKLSYEWQLEGTDYASLYKVSDNSVRLRGKNYATSAQTVFVLVTVSDGTNIVTATYSVTIGAYSGVTKKATAATYSFAGDTGDGTGIVLEDVSEWDMTVADVISSPTVDGLKSQILKNKAIAAYKGSGKKLRFRTTHEANSELTSDIVKTITSLNYNGSSVKNNEDISISVDMNNLVRYAAVTVDGAGTVSANVEFRNIFGTVQAGLFDQDGVLLGNIMNTDAATKCTITADITEATEMVYLIFSRNGGGGSLDVYDITVTPVP